MNKLGPMAQAEKDEIRKLHLLGKSLTEISVAVERSEKAIAKFLGVDQEQKKRGRKPVQKPVDVGVFVQLVPTTLTLPQSGLKVSFDLPKDLPTKDVDVIMEHLRCLYPGAIERAYDTFNKVKEAFKTTATEISPMSEEDQQAEKDYEAIQEIEKSLMSCRRV